MEIVKSGISGATVGATAFLSPFAGVYVTEKLINAGVPLTPHHVFMGVAAGLPIVAGMGIHAGLNGKPLFGRDSFIAGGITLAGEIVGMTFVKLLNDPNKGSSRPWLGVIAGGFIGSLVAQLILGGKKKD